MKINCLLTPLIAVGSIIFFSCAAAPAPAPEPVPEVQAQPEPEPQPQPQPQPVPVPRPKSFLPLEEGWYVYDFERTLKAIENEYNFVLDYGMKMVEELILKQTGTITYYEGGVMYDPVLQEVLSIDAEGHIRGLENPSIIGTVFEDRRFVWTGLVEREGRLNSVSVQGTLTVLPRAARGGSEYDGMYHVTDSGTGREQVVSIKDGFYTWCYLEGDGTVGFTPWPTLIQPDGSFTFETELTTVVEIGESTKSHYSTSFTVTGTITPRQGMSLQELSYSAGMGRGQLDTAPQLYTGTKVSTGEYFNDVTPADAEDTLRTAVQSAKSAKKIDWSPSWYQNPPLKQSAIYALGEKTFRDRETAFALAEAAAAANIAVQVRAYIASSSKNGQANQAESLRNISNVETIPYQVIERFYDEARGTAFTLLELDLKNLN